MFPYSVLLLFKILSIQKRNNFEVLAITSKNYVEMGKCLYIKRKLAVKTREKRFDCHVNEVCKNNSRQIFRKI